MTGRRLPPLNSLRAFEAAARHQSFSRAALELRVTHGAVSHQVAKLEQYLDVKLFDRKQHKAILTKRGVSLAAHLEGLFDQLEAATVQSVADRGLLRIGISPTFAMRFLVPRLVRFRHRYPKINMQIATYIDAPWPHGQETDIDVGVWVGDGKWPNVTSELLCPEQLMPVGAPALVKGHAIHSADDLEPFLLLHALRRPDDWRLWLQAAGATRVAAGSGLKLEYSGLVYEGAITGLGLAMAQTMFVLDDIKSRRLVPLSDQQLRTKRNYYVAYSSSRAEQPEVKSFVNWMKEEIELLWRAPLMRAGCTMLSNVPKGAAEKSLRTV